MSTLSVDTIQGKTTAGSVAFPAGVVIQTVDFTYGTTVATESTGYVDTGVSAVITPKFSNSKIYITGFLHCRISGDHDHGVSFKLRRHIAGSPTDVYTAVSTYEHYFWDGTTTGTYQKNTRFPMFVVDTPNTTSECTYSYQYASMRTDYSNNTKMHENGTPSHGFIMEIAQ
jgi:hypothetical protein